MQLVRAHKADLLIVLVKADRVSLAAFWMQLVKAYKTDLLVIFIKAGGVSLAAFRCSWSEHTKLTC